FVYFVLFFFSSRRRHTRFSRDWSSDVCSSDLADSSAQQQKRKYCRSDHRIPWFSSSVKEFEPRHMVSTLDIRVGDDPHHYRIGNRCQFAFRKEVVHHPHLRW